MGFFDKVFKVIGAVAGAVVGFMIGGPVGAVIGAGLGYAGGGAIGNILGAVFNPGFDVPDADVNQNTGITVNKQGTNNNIPVIYGERYTGGARVGVMSNGEKNQYLYMALVLSEGEINAIKSVYVDDTLVWEGTSTHGQRYTSTLGKFNGYFEFETFHGTKNQTASTLLKQCPGWTNQHALKGLAYLAIRCKWYKIEKTEDQDLTPWKGGLPNVTCVLQGRKVAVASTFASTITRATAYENETQTYSDNPVDCLLDYLRNPIYGKGLSNDKIDFLSFKTEWSRINTLDDGSPAPEDLKQRCNAIIFTDRSIMSNIKTFLFNMRAAMPYNQGRFKISLNDNRDNTSRYGPTSTAVMSFDHDDIIGTVTVNAETNQSKYNRVIVTYMGGKDAGRATNEPIEYTFPEIDSDQELQFLDEDNDRLNEYRFTLEHVTQDSIARKIAEVILAKSRYRSKTIGLTLNARAQALEINDIIGVVYEGLGINGKFRIQNITLNNDYTFSIIAEEHNDLIYSGNPVTFTRRVNKIGDVTIDQPPTYYPKDGNGNPIIDDPKNFDDLVDDYKNNNPGANDDDATEGVLDDIGNGNYVVDTPVDTYRPVSTTINDPVLLSITTATDTVTGKSGTTARLTFSVTPVNNGLIKGVEIWFRPAGSDNYLKYGTSTANETDLINGRYVAYNWPKAQSGFFALKYRGDTMTSGLSNGIYVSDYAMFNPTTISAADGTTVPPSVAIPALFLSNVVMGSSTMTLNFTPPTDGRIKEIEFWARREQPGAGFLRYDYETYTPGTSSMVVPKSDSISNWTYIIRPDTTVGAGYTPNMPDSNKIFVLSTQLTSGTVVDYTQSEPVIIPVKPLEIPVVTSIDVNGVGDEQFIINFTPPVDDRVTGVQVFYLPDSGFQNRVTQTTANLVAGTCSIGNTGTGNNVVANAGGFFYMRYSMAVSIPENPNGSASGDSNKIYVDTTDWPVAPINITRNFKPAPRALPQPLLANVVVAAPSGGAVTNVVTANFNATADQRIYAAYIETKSNGLGSWVQRSATTAATGSPESGVVSVADITEPVTSNGSMMRVKWLDVNSNNYYSNEIWVTRTQLAAPPVTVTSASNKADPLDPSLFNLTINSIQVTKSTTLIPYKTDYYTELVVKFNVPYVSNLTALTGVFQIWSASASVGPLTTVTPSTGQSLATYKTGVLKFLVNPSTVSAYTGSTQVKIYLQAYYSGNIATKTSKTKAVPKANLTSYGTIIT